MWNRSFGGFPVDNFLKAVDDPLLGGIASRPGGRHTSPSDRRPAKSRMGQQSWLFTGDSSVLAELR
jgi:hypothetical protein